MRRPVRLLTAFLVMATTAGCSSVGQAVRGGSPNVWVGSDETAAIMIQIARTKDALTGTLDETGLDDPGAVSAKPVHAAFTGTVDGDALTLTFPQGLGFSSSLSGTLTDKQMSLRVPEASGTVATLTLRPGSVDQYNGLVAGVNDRASANASASQAAAVDAAEAAAESETRQRVDAAAETVADDERALRSTLADAPDFSAFDGDIATARKDLAAAKNDAKTAAGDDDSSEACSDAYSAQSDEFSVQSDSYSIDSDVDSLGGNADTVDTVVTDLGRDLDAYHSAVADAAGYRPSDGPDEGAIRALISTAHSTTKGWRSRGGSYRSAVAGLLAKATTVADQAVKRYC